MERIRLTYEAIDHRRDGLTFIHAETCIPCHPETLSRALAGSYYEMKLLECIVEGLELAQLHDFVPGSLKVSKADTPEPVHVPPEYSPVPQDQDPETILKAITPEMQKHHEARRKAEKAQARRTFFKNLFPHF